MHRLDAAFFRAGEARGALLAKFYAGEGSSEEELLAAFEEYGLEATRLEREGRLLMRPEEDALGGGRGEALGRLLEEEGEGRVLWASFDWVRPVDLDTAFEQQQELTVFVDAWRLVVKTAALEEAIDDWPSSEFRRAQVSHWGTILASEKGLSLSRATQMPHT